MSDLNTIERIEKLSLFVVVVKQGGVRRAKYVISRNMALAVEYVLDTFGEFWTVMSAELVAERSYLPADASVVKVLP